jgi:hypothetical protein
MRTTDGRSSLRLAFRLARRIALQSVGRSALVATLIAIPVIGIVGFVTVSASNVQTMPDQVRFELGHTQALISVVSGADPQLRQDFDGSFQGDNQSAKIAAEPLEDPASYLPAGTRILTTRTVSIQLKTATGITTLGATEGEPWDPSFSGTWDVVAGRTPRTDSEIMVSPGAIARLGTKIGGTVSILKPTSQDVTVVGILKSAQLSNDELGVYGRPGAFDGTAPSADIRSTSFYLPDTPVSWAQVKNFNAHGATVFSREVVLNPPPPGDGVSSGASSGPNLTGILVIGILGGFALFEVALLAGAAFAVGARQQQRALAVLASVGGDSRILFRVISFGGVLLGLIGSVVGSGLGLLGAAFFMSWQANGRASQFPEFRIDWVATAAAILLATLAAWISAAIPARAASRTDIVASLRGATRPPRPTRRRPIVGVVLVLVGLVVSLAGGIVIVSANTATHNQQFLSTVGITLIVVGPVTMQVGAALIAPLILRWSARLFSQFGAGARMGARDASRNPSRSVPALAAIMSTVFVASFVIAILGGSEASGIKAHEYQTPLNSALVTLYSYTNQNTQTLENVGPAVVTAVNSGYGGNSARILSSAPSPLSDEPSKQTSFAVPREYGRGPAYLTDGYGGDQIWVGSAADLTAIMGEPASAAALATYNSGGVVAFYPQFVKGGRATFDWRKNATSTTILRTASLPAVVDQPKHEYYFGLFMSPAAASSIGVKYAPSAVFDQLTAAPTQQQQDAMQLALSGIGSGNFNSQVETGPTYFAQFWGWSLVLFTALIALVSATIAITLARADGKRDDTVLGAVGASPAVRRAFGFWQAIILTGIGSIVGVALGLVPAFALSIPTGPAGATQILPFDPSWPQLVITAIGIPLLIAAGSWLTAGRQRVSYGERAPIG